MFHYCGFVLHFSKSRKSPSFSQQNGRDFPDFPIDFCQSTSHPDQSVMVRKFVLKTINSVCESDPHTIVALHQTTLNVINISTRFFFSASLSCRNKKSLFKTFFLGQ